MLSAISKILAVLSSLKVVSTHTCGCNRYEYERVFVYVGRMFNNNYSVFSHFKNIEFSCVVVVVVQWLRCIRRVIDVAVTSNSFETNHQLTIFSLFSISGAITVGTLATIWQLSVLMDLYQRDATTVRQKIT